MGMRVPGEQNAIERAYTAVQNAITGAESGGTSFGHLELDTLRDLEKHLAPLAEQQFVLAMLDAARDNLPNSHEGIARDLLNGLQALGWKRPVAGAGHIPDTVCGAFSKYSNGDAWCILPTGHDGDHKDQENYRWFTPADRPPVYECDAKNPLRPSLRCARPEGHDGMHESGGGAKWNGGV